MPVDRCPPSYSNFRENGVDDGCILALAHTINSTAIFLYKGRLNCKQNKLGTDGWMDGFIDGSTTNQTLPNVFTHAM